jgi:glycerol-3-phosphate acyltransferase PlsY
MLTGKEWTLVLASYALGCFASGYYWVRWRAGQDLRALGSGSLGARNVGRVLGPWGFAVTLLMDVTKGALATGAAIWLGLSGDAIVACLVAVVVGHIWPAQLRFHGGKGVATSIGALLAYDPFLGLILGVLFAPVFTLLRRFTLSGLLAFALSPLLVFLCGLGNEEVAAVSFLAILILISHRRNIREEIACLVAGGPAKENPDHPTNGAAS